MRWPQGSGLRLLYGGASHPAPLGPRSVVDADVIAPEQVGEDEPGGAGAPPDRAVGDQLFSAGEIDGGEDRTQVGDGQERSALIVQTVDRLVNRRGDVTGPAARLQAARGPEPLPRYSSQVRTSTSVSPGAPMAFRTAL